MPTISFSVSRPDDFPVENWEAAMQDLFDYLVEITPVDTGYCADSWEMDVDDDGAEFFNGADYSSYLDEGWSSQAPQGMIDPALDKLGDILSNYY